MGATISSPNRSLEMGYFSFNRMRNDIAALISDEFGEHYRALDYAPQPEEDGIWYKAYDAKTKRLVEELSNDGEVAAAVFLYSSDAEGRLDADDCCDLLEFLTKANADEKGDPIIDPARVYGYVARADAATFQDFLDALSDGYMSGEGIEWL